jgi:nitrogen fixation NifU-like protein
MYSDKVMDHFKNPRNVGEIGDADGVGTVGNPVCGDMMTMYIKVKDGKITRQSVAEALDGLPPVKMHCSNLASDALHEAIKDYKKKQEEKKK